MERLLESRVRYFLTSRHRGREDVRLVLQDLQRMGRLVLIGGMLRDIALFGNAGFRSDLDFVIDPYDYDAFRRRMAEIGAKVNRFGGYALPFRRWQIDVWPLERTWANVEGHVKVRTVRDLRKVTFFRCDAAIYDLSHRRIIARQGYFDDLRERLLEINLEPNPNPQGNAVRAIRYALLKGFRWGPSLTRFVAEAIETVGWSELSAGERRSFNTEHLASLDCKHLQNALDQHLSSEGAAWFDPRHFQRNVQLPLPALH